jgi:predicted glycogen debranching enzyme
MTSLKRDYTELSSKEWLVTNGLGGYASSSIIGSNTRRYHGILVASLNPPTERRMIVSKVEESIYYNNQEIKFSSNQYKDVVHPEGFNYFEAFEREPLPKIVFKADNAELSKTIFMVYNSNTSVIEYKNSGNTKYHLRLNPLYTSRDFHKLSHEDHSFNYSVVYNSNKQSIRAHLNSEPFYFKYSQGKYTELRLWNKNFHYFRERERGQDYTEDLYSLGFLSLELEPGSSVFLLFTLDPVMLEKSPEILKQSELDRLKNLVSEHTDKFLTDLLKAGDQFIVNRKSTGNYSVIAGYHWFSDWGRDSMIALRGLCIATGRQKEAASVIITFLNYLQQGVIPNRFPDYANDHVEYHTIDATLWLFIAVYEYDLKFKDIDFLKTVYPKLVEIINHYLIGSKYNIHVLENGLLYGGTMGLPLTWMDARIKDHIFTPRIGCPVEVNALWYNALNIYEHVSSRVGDKPNELYMKIRKKVETQFAKSFWNPSGYLNDLVTIYNKVDTSFRPNQIYAVSLPFRLLSEEQERQVVTNVGKYLLTEYGLRTLSADHPDFKSSYSGDLWSRDTAYHQGTVWPFLIAEYFMAYLKVNGYSDKSKKYVEEKLKPLKEHFYSHECIHGISEIFDGMKPYEGKGCIHQAWSVSNLILLILKEGLVI